MRKLKIYLETTLFNFYFDSNRDAHLDTVRLFSEIKEGKFDAYTSVYVVDELELATEPKRSKMMSLINEYNIKVLAPNEKTFTLAKKYVDNGIIPEKYNSDALHIASASVNNLDIIISMNFQHIVKRKTKIGTASINALNGYKAVEIFVPMEVIENE